MYENHRDNFGRRRYQDERGRDNEWRRSEERYRREADERDQFDRDRYGSQVRNRDYGYERTSREQDEYGWFGGESDGYGWRAGESRGGRSYLREQAPRRSQPSYYGTDQDRPGDSSYFTGTQGSWAMPSPDRASTYGASSYGGGGGFGADYREHGYGRGSDGDHRGFLDRAGDEIASWFGDEDAARRREHDHRGRGPKNYVRSDERIHDDANDRLTDDWRLDAENITVTVANGEVTLDGTVTDRAAKRRAEDIVEDISGVKHVQNNLRVADRGMAGGETGAATRATTSPGMTSTGATGSATTNYGSTGATSQNATAKEPERT